MDKLLTLLKGKKTYILGGIMALQALYLFFIGDLPMEDMIRQVTEGLGFMAVRAGIAAK